MKTGLDDFLVSEGSDKFQSLVKETSYDQSILELQEHALKLLDFSESQNFKYEYGKDSVTFFKDNLKIKVEGQVEDCTITVFRKVSSKYDLLCKEKLDLTKGSNKNNLLKNSDLEKGKSKELRRFIDAILEFFNIQSEVDRVEKRITSDFKKEYPHELSLSQDKRDRALNLAKSPNLLYQINKAVESSGLVGEKVNGLLLYLALTSRILEKPISIVIKAGSSAGKSFLLNKVLQLFPKDAYIELTGLSPKSLIYMKESFSHRFLIIYEAHGVFDDEYTDYIIRTLLSENKIKYATVEKNNRDRHQTRIVEKEGPTGLITTTTSPSIHDENETRLFSITVEESGDQTRRIKDRIADKYNHFASDDTTSLSEDYRNLQKIIKPIKVLIPYAKALSELTPSEPLRVRRDFERILVVIEVVALLHQHQREIKIENGIEYIEATLEDYYIAKELLSETLDVTILDKYPQIMEIVDAVNLIYKETSEPVMVKDLESKFKKPKKTITRWLKPALEHGWIENNEDEGRGKPFKLVPGKFVKQEYDFLPSARKLALQWDKSKIEDFSVVNPITGKEVELKKIKKLIRRKK